MHTTRIPTPSGAMRHGPYYVRSLATGPINLESTGSKLLVRAMVYTGAAVINGTAAWMLWCMATWPDQVTQELSHLFF
jgi:hypothetical protein